MNNEQKDAITRLRMDGRGYKYIAKHLRICESTVKTYCRRNSLKNADLDVNSSASGVLKKPSVGHCKNCGVEVTQYPGRKEKKFCCDRCRNTWWNTYLADVKRMAFYDFICPTCGKSFSAYGNRNRKYCSQSCYIKARFGSSRDTAIILGDAREVCELR